MQEVDKSNYKINEIGKCNTINSKLRFIESFKFLTSSPSKSPSK